MPLTPSQLRENLYRILDQVLETGAPVEVVRKGRIIRLVPPDDPLENYTPMEGLLLCEPEELLGLDWSGEWKP